jgi:ribonuclease HI
MTSDSCSEEKGWKAIWKICAPGKMKTTLWRFAHDCLPSGRQLQHRHVPTSSTCIHCSAEEDVQHAMLLCPFARDVWENVKKTYQLKLNRKCFNSPKLWLFDFLSKCSSEAATALAVTFWHLWDVRNKVREEGGPVNPSSVALRIKAYIDMILTHLAKQATSPRSEDYSAVPWTPPPAGNLLINVDAALFSSSKKMGAGVVVRDHNGDCIAACCNSFPNVTIPELAEAMAVRLALSFARDEGLDNLIIASDCLSVVQRAKASSRDRSFCGPVFEDIKSLMSSFGSCSIRHVYRGQNVAAHCLARSSEDSSMSVWRGVPPECIQDTICIDSMFG